MKLETYMALQSGKLRAMEERAVAAESALADARKELAWIGEFAKAHHDQQEAYVFLHALTIDIPSYVDAALAARPEKESL